MPVQIFFALLFLSLSSFAAQPPPALSTKPLPSKKCDGGASNNRTYKLGTHGFIHYCRDKAGTQHILLRGNIKEGDESKIDSVVSRIQRGEKDGVKNTVFITENALGGLVSEHNKLAEAVKKICKKKKDNQSQGKCETHMIGICASACNSIHAGPETKATSDSQNCFHSATIGNKKVAGADKPLVTGTLKAKNKCVNILKAHDVFKFKELTCIPAKALLHCKFATKIDDTISTKSNVSQYRTPATPNSSRARRVIADLKRINPK